MPLDEILNDLNSHLEYERDEGCKTVEVSPETIRQISAPPVVSSPASQSASAVSSENPDQSQTTKEILLEKVAVEIAACHKCELCKGRTNTVPGQGTPTPEIMFVGEAPGADEDKQGLPFVGKAGKLLTKMIAAMGFTRDEVFIANINKCRPPDNRVPTPVEMETCMPYLKQQISILKPKVIIAMGATAVKGLVGLPERITKYRGTWTKFEGIDLMPTLHPAYLLRSPSAKRPVWEDLQVVLKRIGKPVPK